MAIVKQMMKDRFDLSDYLIHFTRNKEFTSFHSLLEIVQSGYIKCGWSVRNAKRTVFGKYPAVCFTDMPLFSFYQYVLNRADETKVDFYGVALHKKDMFRLGARNVIYGTTNHVEVENSVGANLPPEMLNPALRDEEQYRYMLTAIMDTNDWTHEREWRWTNQYGYSKADYLPVWLTNIYDKHTGDRDFYFQYPIFLIVKTSEEINTLKNEFSTLMAKFNVTNIKNTHAISLEDVKIAGKLSYDGMTFLNLHKNKVTVSVI